MDNDRSGRKAAGAQPAQSCVPSWTLSRVHSPPQPIVKHLIKKFGNERETLDAEAEKLKK
jgi:hypothetical protein